MYHFVQLVRNENMKIYARWRTWAMLACVIGFPFFTMFISSLLGDRFSVITWDFFTYISLFNFGFITIFTVVVSADSVAEEFSKGTIKLFLIRPWTRSILLLAKFSAVLIFSLLLYCVTFGMSFLMVYFLHPSDSFSSHTEYILLFYLLRFISLIVLLAFSFMFSTVFRSSALAIGLSITMYFVGDLLAQVLVLTDKPWVEYILFPHLDLTQYLDYEQGMYSVEHATSFGFSLSVLSVYFIIFMGIAWTVFNKRDVLA